MKELSIEEKAKAYDDALERAKYYRKENGSAVIPAIFPELIEDEDERIRKWIINEIKIKHHNLDENNVNFVDKAIAWLEKQGEQKPTDKVEPKFKVGDWIVYEEKCYKVNYNGCGYELIDQNGLKGSLVYGVVDNNAHLWTINDAKDGDILVSSNKPFIYNGKFNNICVGAYGGLNVIYSFIVAQHEVQWASNDDIKPATKEQRDSLTEAMTEAGYVFDFDKRELKKVISDAQPTKVELTVTAIITGELLIKNGFEHRSGKFSDCYDIKFNAEAYIDLIQDKKSNTEWTLEILKHNDHSICANRLVETISTIKELQDCLDKMNINLKIKY